MNCTVHGVAKSRTRLSDFHFYSHTPYCHIIVYLLSLLATMATTKAVNHHAFTEHFVLFMADV